MEPLDPAPAYARIRAALSAEDLALFDETAAVRLGAVLPADDGLLAVAAVTRQSGRALAIVLPGRLVVLRVGPAEATPALEQPLSSPEVLRVDGRLVTVPVEGHTRAVGVIAEGYDPEAFAAAAGASGPRQRAGAASPRTGATAGRSIAMVAAGVIFLVLAFLTAITGIYVSNHVMTLHRGEVFSRRVLVEWLLSATVPAAVGLFILGLNEQLAHLRLGQRSE